MDIENPDTTPTSVTPEDIAKELGFESYAEMQAASKRFRELDGWQNDLNRRSMEVANAERNTSFAPPAQAPVDDDDWDVDAIPPGQMKVLEKVFDKFATEKINPQLSVAVESVEEQGKMVLDQFLKQHPELNSKQVFDTMDQEHLWPQKVSVRELERALNHAEKIIRAETLDPEEIRRQAKEEALKELQSQGAEVVEITPKGSVDEPMVDADDDNWYHRQQAAMEAIERGDMG